MSKIKICGKDRTINILGDDTDPGDYYGLCSSRSKSIDINDHSMHQKDKAYVKYDVVLHEIMHAIINETCHDQLFSDKQQEVICGLVEKHLGKILRDNNYLKDFNSNHKK